MKHTILVFLLFTASLQLFAQEPWCFSLQCEQTQISVFANPHQAPFYKPSVIKPRYQPVSPLALSLSTKRFFVRSEPMNTLPNPFFNYELPQLSPAVSMGRLGISPPTLPSNSAGSTPSQSGTEGGHSFATGAQGFTATGGRFK